MAETKMNKTRRSADRLRAFIRLKCNLIFTIKKILFFFNQSGTFPSKVFWSRFDPNATIKRSHKVKRKAVGSETSREKIVPRCIRTRTKNQTPKLTFQHYTTTAYSLPTHVTHRATIPNQLLKNDFSWPVIWWKKLRIFSDIPTFIFF